MNQIDDIVLIAHNLRSTHNIGSLLRTAEGLGVKRVFLTGYTPYPLQSNDLRLPHLAAKIDKQIAKTALGAELLVTIKQSETIEPILAKLKAENYVIVGLEQNPQSTLLAGYQPPNNIALIVGREVEGLEPEVISACDQLLEIPMLGRKESFNVVQAAAMALYHLRYPSSL